VEIFTRWSETAERDVHFVLCNNLDTRIWMANLASLEIHATLSTTTAYESPDLLLFDIDPEPSIPNRRSASTT
jgi:bifunctional non-homologous end joining protein LigD